MTYARAGILWLSLLGLSGCGGPSKPPSVVLVTLDTTRHDRLGTYGDPSARTPFFDAIARGGVLCRNAFVDAPTTLPSHATMLTGSTALRHGVRVNGRFALPEEAVTFTELVEQRGWSTAAVISSAALAADHGLNQGFHEYDDTMPSTYPIFAQKWQIRRLRLAGNQRRAWQTTAAALECLPALTRPAFIWVHYVDAHQPVDPPPPWDRVPGLSGYSAEVAVVDREMGRFLRAVGPALGPHVVAILADHGEALGEHRYFGHGLFLYDTVIRIPFVVSAPGLAPAILSSLVRNSDVPAVLADLVDVPGTFEDGVNFLEEASPGFIFVETLSPTRRYGGSATKALRTEIGKYILSPKAEYYDLVADPGESTNRWTEHGEDQREMKRQLSEYVQGVLAEVGKAATSVSLDESQLEALRALGYAAGPSKEKVIPATELSPIGIDPKDIVDIDHAVRAVNDGILGDVRERIDRFWSEHPDRPDSTWRSLYSRAHFCRAALAYVDGDYDGARRDIAESRSLDPTYRDPVTLLETIARREAETLGR